MKSLRQMGFSLALIFAILGSLNWGIVGFFKFDFIAWSFQWLGISLKIAHGIIGISGLFLFFNLGKLLRRL